jgi:HEAT repeat protein
VRWIVPSWLAALIVLAVQSGMTAAPVEESPVQEWQIKGIVSALQDENEGVRMRAARKLAELLGAGEHDLEDEVYKPGKNRQLLGSSVQLASSAKDDLLALLRSDGPDARKYAAAALGGLGDKSVVPELIKLLDDQEIYVRGSAAQALGRLGDARAVPDLLVRVRPSMGYDTDRAVWALGQIGDQRAVPHLLDLFNIPINARNFYGRTTVPEALWRLGATEVLERMPSYVGDGVPGLRQYAAESLGAIGDSRGLPTLVDFSRDEDSTVRRLTAESLGRLGDKRAVPELLALLKDGDATVRASAAGALGRLEAKEAISELFKLLEDSYPTARWAAAQALGSLGDKEAVPQLLALRKDDDGWVRRTAVEALARLGYPGAENELRAMLNDDDAHVRISAAEALARIGVSASVPDPLEITRAGLEIVISPRDSVHSRALSAIEELKPQSFIIFLRYPYQHSEVAEDARWLAHYWGGGSNAARILCAYLGRPAVDPNLPQTREEALDVLAALEYAWEESESWEESKRRWLREDVASWASLIIDQRTNDWQAQDVPTLKEFLVRFQGAENLRTRTNTAAIDRVIAPFEISPPPWARTLLAAAAVNVVAILLVVLRPGRSDLERWLPFLGFTGAGVGSWMANFTIDDLQLNTWLLAGILLGELVVLTCAGVFSTPVLRQIARIEPLGRIAVPLTLRLPWARRRFFREHVVAVANQLARDQRQASEENYVSLPAVMTSSANTAATTQLEPAADILRFLTARLGCRGHVFIQAPGGRGKSALLREVVRLALWQFENHPGDTPLPVLLSGKGESIEEMLDFALGGVLLMPEALAMHLEAGDFFVVVDGISESGLSEQAVSSFVQGMHGGNAPLLVSSRPSKAYRDAIEGTARWTVVEPLRLNQELLGKFVRHYGGQDLTADAEAACRGPDGTYLPILVRMAMTISRTDSSRAGLADIYRGYFLRLFEAQFPDEGERLKWLGRAAQWCLETYWRDGMRKRVYDADDVQQGLMKAGLLVSADDLTPPSEVHFFHDSMQSYLTAHGLAVQDRQGYQLLPRPVDDPTQQPWDRSRVLLWAAANEKFAKAQSDILHTGGNELYQMCLATFVPREGLRQWLHDQIKAWAAEHDENLRRKDILAAISSSLADRIKGARGAARLLTLAADASFEADEHADSLQLLGALYVGIAPHVYAIIAGDKVDSEI